MPTRDPYESPRSPAPRKKKRQASQSAPMSDVQLSRPSRRTHTATAPTVTDAPHKETRQANLRRGAAPTGGPGKRQGQQALKTARSTSTAEIQRQLRRAGFAIAVDGEWGPQTAKAWASYSGSIHHGAVANAEAKTEYMKRALLYPAPNHAEEFATLGPEAANALQEARDRMREHVRKITMEQTMPSPLGEHAMTGVDEAPPPADLDPRSQEFLANRARQRFLNEQMFTSTRQAPDQLADAMDVVLGKSLTNVLTGQGTSDPFGAVAEGALWFTGPLKLFGAGREAIQAGRAGEGIIAGARAGHAAPNVIPPVVRTARRIPMRVVRASGAEHLVPDFQSRTGRTVQRLANAVRRPASNVRGIKSPEQIWAEELRRSESYKARAVETKAARLEKIKLNDGQETALRIAAEQTPPLERRLYHEGAQQDAITKMHASTDEAAQAGYKRRALYHGIHANSISKAEKYIDVVDGKAQIAATAPEKLKEAYNLALEVSGTREDLYRGLELLSEETIANRASAPARFFRGARYRSMEQMVKESIEAHPYVVESDAQIDQLVANGQMSAVEGRATKSLNRAAFRVAAISEDPEALAGVQFGLHFGDELTDESLPPIVRTLYQQAEQGDSAFIDGYYRRVARNLKKHPGAPFQVRNVERLSALMTELRQRAIEAEAYKRWYTHSAQAIIDHVHGDIEQATKLAKLLAIYSPRARVWDNSTWNNVTRAIGAYDEYMAHGLVSPRWSLSKQSKKEKQAIEYAGVTGKEGPKRKRDWQTEAANAAMSGQGDWSGLKTNNFFRNFLEDINPEEYRRLFGDAPAVTFDTWMRRAFKYPKTGEKKTETITEEMYDFGSQATVAIAHELGWEPKEAQAAIWTSIKSELEGTPLDEAGVSFSDALRAQRERGGQGTLFQHGGLSDEEQAKINAYLTARDSGMDADTLKLMQERLEIGDELLDRAAGGAPYNPYTNADVPLRGLPPKGSPSPEIRNLALDYMTAKGIDISRIPVDYVKVNESRARRIAAWYDKAASKPDDPAVRSSYEAMARETLDQYNALVDAGYTFEFYPATGEDPYGSPWRAMEDLRDNKHLYVFPTEEGFGTEMTATVHPLLAQSGVTWGDRPATHNDIFRAVHDVFGHHKEGVGFRADGEENAWRQHSAMYSDLARPAMTSETRGQNSWVNFGPHGEANQTADQLATVYADQKAVLAPEWVVREGSGIEDAAARARQAKAARESNEGPTLWQDEDFQKKARDMIAEWEAFARDIRNTLPEEDWPEWVKRGADLRANPPKQSPVAGGWQLPEPRKPVRLPHHTDDEWAATLEDYQHRLTAWRNEQGSAIMREAKSMGFNPDEPLTKQGGQLLGGIADDVESLKDMARPGKEDAVQRFIDYIHEKLGAGDYEAAHRILSTALKTGDPLPAEADFTLRSAISKLDALRSKPEIGDTFPEDWLAQGQSLNYYRQMVKHDPELIRALGDDESDLLRGVTRTARLALDKRDLPALKALTEAIGDFRTMAQTGGSLALVSPFGIKGSISFGSGLPTELPSALVGEAQGRAVQAVVRFSQHGDVTTFVHEVFGHYMPLFLSEEDKLALTKWAGGNFDPTRGQLDRLAAEKVARGLEEFFRSHEAPPGVRQAFKSVQPHFQQLYNGIDLPDINNDIARIFRGMFETEKLKGAGWVGGDSIGPFGAFRVPYVRGRPLPRGVTRIHKTVSMYTRYLLSRGDVISKGADDIALRKAFTASGLEAGYFTLDVRKAMVRDLVTSVRLTTVHRVREDMLRAGSDIPRTEHDIAVKINPDESTPDQVRMILERMREIDENGGKISPDMLKEIGFDEMTNAGQYIFPSEVDGIEIRKLAAELMNTEEPHDNIKWIPREWLEYSGLVPPVGRGAQIARALKGNPAMIALDALNDLQRMFVLYLNPAYIPINLIGNLGMNIMQQGIFTPVNLWRSAMMHFDMEPWERLFVDRQMGEGLTYALTSTRFTPGELIHATLGRAINMAVDLVPRRSAFLHAARQHGYNNTPAVRDLIKRAAGGEDAALADVDVIGRVARDAIVDYERMTPLERELTARLIFFYPWLKGATRWSYRFALEHPMQAAGLMVLGEHAYQIQQQQLGATPYYEQFDVPISTESIGVGPASLSDVVGEHAWTEDVQGQQMPMVVDVKQALTMTTPVELIEAAIGFATGNKNAQSLVENLTPAIYGAGVALFGKDPFRKRDVPQSLGTFLAQMRDVPQSQKFQAITMPADERRQRQAHSINPRSREESWWQTFGSGLAPTPYSRSVAAERLLSNQPTKARHKAELKRDSTRYKLGPVSPAMLEQLEERDDMEHEIKSGMIASDKVKIAKKYYARHPELPGAREIDQRIRDANTEGEQQQLYEMMRHYLQGVAWGDLSEREYYIRHHTERDKQTASVP